MKIWEIKLENGKQIQFAGNYILPSESTYYIAFKQYSVSIFYDLLFVVGLVCISIGFSVLLKKYQTQTNSLVNWIVWFLVSYLFTFDYIHQGTIHLAKWNRVHGNETWVYVYNIFENQGPRLNPDSLIDNQQSVLDLDKMPLVSSWLSSIS